MVVIARGVTVVGKSLGCGMLSVDSRYYVLILILATVYVCVYVCVV